MRVIAEPMSKVDILVLGRVSNMVTYIECPKIAVTRVSPFVDCFRESGRPLWQTSNLSSSVEKLCQSRLRGR